MKNFFKENLIFLIFVLIFFLIGVILGSISANTLTYTQKKALLDYLSGFTIEVNQLLSEGRSIVAKDLIVGNLKFALLFWVLGITLVGASIVPFIIFLRGFIIGFTATFIMREMFFKGVLLVFLAMFPQNIIMIPSLILASFFTLVFVFKAVSNILFRRRYNLQQGIVYYSIIMGGIGICLFVAALIEINVTPRLIQIAEGFILNP
ncbi:stage II sporulation protein M [Halonatronum saccharophilum]|uniref:stage II sporulation protein M n=1 Tax=Halonatronum saccharophilum TaxID=150060 RepID=UPI0004845CA6|nr:stage II sporulation protein M [Halonatronum saccharophilum]